MSRSSAEKVGFLGGMLLGGALVAAVILLLYTRRGRETTQRRTPPPAGGTVQVSTEPVRTVEPDPDTPTPKPDPDPEPVYTGSDSSKFRAERKRLRNRIAELQAEIERLKEIFEREGIEIEEAVADPGEIVRKAIAGLQECGSETAAVDIDAFVEQIIRAGSPGAPIVAEFLGKNFDVAYSDLWTRYGRRFTAYPGMRVALIDALVRTGEEGSMDAQYALMGLLRRAEDPLEICLLVEGLYHARSVEEVGKVLTDACGRYLKMAPAPKEQFVVAELLEMLSELPPGESDAALLAYYRNVDRRLERALGALFKMRELPEDRAVAVLVKAVALRDQENKAIRAAEILAGMPGTAVVEALARVLGAGALGTAGLKVRRAIYRSLDRPVRDGYERVKRLGSPLETLAALDELEADLEARRKLLGDRRSEEPRGDVRTEMDTVSGLLDETATLLQALRKNVRGK